MLRLFLLTALCSLLASPAAACIAQREAVTLHLADFASAGEIVTPPQGMAAKGIAVLFAGSDVADMDGAIVGEEGAIISQPLRQVADRLACAGIASLRYDKRHVSGPNTVDREQFAKLNGADLAADGRTALAFARSRAAFAALPVAVIGWSEGTTVAMAVAAADPEVKAIALLAPVVAPMAKTVQAQYARIGRPYLMQFATDGALDAEAIARADQGPGGIMAEIFVRMFRGFRPGERINPLLDTNGDGRIAFAEADPIIASWYADGPDSGLGMASSARALKGVAAAWTPSFPPVLMLQGTNDAMVSPDAAQAFAARADTQGRVSLRLYSGLGHSLGPAPSDLEDGLLPMAQAPLDDLAGWMTQTLSAAQP